jgi:uncharacterized surface protein with fasciclin (FAS1) repeats
MKPKAIFPLTLTLVTVFGAIAVNDLTNAKTLTENSQSPVALEIAQTSNVGNLLEVAAAEDDLSTFTKAVEAAGLKDSLSGSDQFTVFAPTDAAFNAIPEATREALLKPENKALLSDILAYHVAPGKVMASDVKTGTIDTLGGGLAVKVEDGKVLVNNGSVVAADVNASNGVIHKVNRVMLSPQLQKRVAALTPVRALW